MKKIFSVLLAVLVLATMLAACGGGGDSSAAAGNSGSGGAGTSGTSGGGDSDMPVVEGLDGKTVGVCIYQFSDNFMTLYRNELQRYLEGGGATVQVMDGKNDQAEQTNQIQNFITQGVDVLIINLVQSSSAPQIADLCHAANIPVVFINREPEAEEEQRWEDEEMRATYVGADARQSGTYQGEIVLDLEDKGDADGDGVVRYVMIQGDPENVDAQHRTEFSIKALTDAGVEVDQVFQQRGDWDQAKGQELAANALAADGDKIDVIFCNNDSMAMGALQAIQSAGRKVNEDIYLLGVDALSEALDEIDAGNMTGTVFNDHFSQARLAGDKASDFYNDVAVDPVNMVDYIKVTQENAAEIKALL